MRPIGAEKGVRAMRVASCVVLLVAMVVGASSGCCADDSPVDRFLQGVQQGQSLSSRAAERRAQEAQGQRERDDYAEPAFWKCLNDPSWRKSVTTQSVSETLAGLQAIEKRRYGMILTKTVPSLTPLWLEDMRKWGATANPSSENYKLIVKAMFLTKYGESALAQIASELQKTATPADGLPKDWRSLVDDMLAKWTPPQGTDPLLAARTPIPAKAATLTGTSAAPSAAAFPSTTSTVQSSQPTPSILKPIESSITTLLPTLNDDGDSSRAGLTYLGRLSSNRYDLESTSDAYGTHGNPYGNTLTNPYSPYGSKYSSTSWSNPYATDAPRIYAQDGTYLGKLSTNPFDPDSISNPYGQYGNPYGNNLMNTYGVYGSKYSSQSWTNPYTTTAPGVYGSSPYSSSYSLPKLPSLGD